MRAHPAGPLHAGIQAPPETAGPRPIDAAGLDELAAAVWPRDAARGADGALRARRRRRARARRAVRHPAVRDRRGRLPVPRRRVRRRLRRPTRCTTRPRRSCAPRSPAGWPRRACRWTCAAAASSRSRCAPASRPSGSRCTATTSRTPSWSPRSRPGVGRVVLDSFHEIARLDAVARDRGVVAPVMVRLTVGVEAHTHEFIATAHEDQKFGFSIAGGRERRGRGGAPGARAPTGCALVGLHSHIGSQIFDTEGFEVAAHRVVRFLAELHDEHGADALAALDHPRPRWRLRHRLPRRRDPARRAAAGRAAARDRQAGVPRGRSWTCRGSPSSPAGRSPGRARSRSTRSARSRTSPLGGGHGAPLRERRRRDERQHPHRALRRASTTAGWSRAARAERAGGGDGGALPGGRQALRERRHRGPRLLAAGRPRPRRPARGGRDRRLLLLDGQLVQPAAAPGRGRRAGRRGAGAAAPGDRRGPVPARGGRHDRR